MKNQVYLFINIKFKILNSKLLSKMINQSDYKSFAYFLLNGYFFS